MNEENNYLKKYYKRFREFKEKTLMKIYDKFHIEKNGETDNKISKKRRSAIITSITIFIIIIILITAFIKIIIPNIYINSINNRYSLQQYDKVAEYNSKLNMIESYFNINYEKYKEIQYKVKLSNALILFENSQFTLALNELQEIQIKDETIKNKINDCKYELVKEYIENGNNDKAIEYLLEGVAGNDTADLLDKAYYNLSLQYLNNKEYSKALEEISKIENKEYENLQNTKQKIHYEYGKYFLSRDDYNGGISQLEQAKDYEDANTLVNNAYIEKAEKYIKDGKIQEAKNIYDYLPNEVEYNGIKVSDRKSQLNKIASIINSTGKKYATKSYCESRNVWKYDGRWENWYIDTPDSSEYIDTSLKLNDDGTFDLSGKVYFYAFNDFSSLQKYCNAKIISRTINIKNINSIPSTYDIDENTKLLYSKGIFSIKYSKRDDYSTNFYNLYNSSVTF